MSSSNTQTTLTSILQYDIFTVAPSSTSHLTLLVTHPQNLPVRPLHLPLLFVPYCDARLPNNALSQQSCILFSLNESQKHYQSIYQRLNRKRAAFQIVDLFGYVCGENALIEPLELDSMEALIREFITNTDSTHCTWQNVDTVIIDDFHMLSFYYSQAQVLALVRAILAKNVHLVISMEHMEMVASVHDVLNAMANVVVSVQGLESGYSKDVHGLMRVTYSEEERLRDAPRGTMHVREKVLQYKVTDREVKLFGKGHQGLF